jgi:hypothetical protein
MNRRNALASATAALIVAASVPFTRAQTTASTKLSSEDAAAAVRELIQSGLDHAVSPSVPPLPTSLDAAVSELRSRGDTAVIARLAGAWSEAIAEVMPNAHTAASTLAARIQPRDPVALLAGGNDAATAYFRGASEDAIARAIQPAVRDAIGRARVTDALRAFATAASSSGIEAPALRASDLERAVTDATLHELFLEVASQEARLRRDPARGSTTLQRAMATAGASTR